MCVGRGTIALPRRGFALLAQGGSLTVLTLPKEQTVYAYPSGALGWLGIVSQGFRPELMTKDSSGVKLLTIARL